MNLERVKILGIYLVTISSLQVALYLTQMLTTEINVLLNKLDPRFGLDILGTLCCDDFKRPNHVASNILRWFSAIWIYALGALMIFSRPVIKMYIISEIILALPSLLILFMSLTYGSFSEGLRVLISVTILFTLVPIILAVSLLRSKTEKSAR